MYENHRECMVERNAYVIWWENGKEKDHLKDTDEDGKITLKWTLKKYNGRV